MNAVAKLHPSETAVDPLAKLREPFPDNQVSKLPKPTKAQTDEVKGDFKKGIRCKVCGSWHHPDVVHLDYVGHAALTDRLLDTDPHWNWEPVGLTPEGLPAFDRNGGLWIKLTVCGVTRLGYGNAEGKSGGDAVKEIIGDALRNAGMRFGAALDLWHKGDLHVDEGEPRASAAEMAINLLKGCGNAEFFKETWAKNCEGWKKILSPEDAKRVWAVKDECVARWQAEAQAARAEAEAQANANEPPHDPNDPFSDEIPF